MEKIVAKFYIEYNCRGSDVGENDIFYRGVLEANSLDDVKKMLPNREIFQLPWEKINKYWTSSNVYYEWAEEIKYYMYRWTKKDIISWYEHNLTEIHKVSLLESTLHKSKLKEFRGNIPYMFLFVLGFIDTLFFVLPRFIWNWLKNKITIF